MMTGRVTVIAGREGAENERQQKKCGDPIALKMLITSFSFLVHYACTLLDLSGLVVGFKVIYELGICHSLFIPRFFESLPWARQHSRC